MSISGRWFTAGLLLLLVSIVPGCSSDEVRIGAIISETGDVAPYGKTVRRGMDLALEQANAKGFELGPVSLIYKNDASDPATGLAAAEALVEEVGVRVIIGAISSPVTLEIAPYVERKRTVLLSPASSVPEISEAGDYVFRNYPSDVLEGTAMADFARDLELKRVVIVALDNVWGSGLADLFRRGFESRVREVSRTLTVPSGDMSGFDSLVEEIRGLDPDGIYVVLYIEEEVELLRRLHQANLGAVVLSTSASATDVVRRAGEAAEGLVYPQPAFDAGSSDTHVAQFVSAYRAAYDEEPDIYAAHGYDAVNLILEAMRKVGSAHPDDVKRGLLGISDFPGAAGRTGFNELGDVTRYPRLFIVESGRSVPYEEYIERGGTPPSPQS